MKPDAIAAVFLIPAVAAGAPATAPSPATAPAGLRITPSRETTFVRGPLLPDGTIDYAAALDGLFSKGITPRNNAAVLLVPVLGPDRIHKPRAATGVLKRLGLKSGVRGRGLYAPLSAVLAVARRRAASSGEAGALPESAMELLRQAVARPWTARQLPVAAEWLRVNDAALRLVAAASRRQRYYLPLGYEPPAGKLFDASVPRLAAFFDVGSAFVARAMQKAGSADVAGARADLLAAQRLGRLLGQGVTAGERRIALDLLRLSCHGERALLGTVTAHTTAAATLHLKALSALPPVPDLRDVYDRTERLTALDFAMLVARKSRQSGDAVAALAELIRLRKPDGEAGPTDPGAAAAVTVDWDEALRAVNRWYDQAGDALGQTNYAVRARALRALQAKWKRAAARVNLATSPVGLRKLLESGADPDGGGSRQRLSRNFGELLACLLAPESFELADRAETEAMDFDLVRLALALWISRARTGRLPARLASLVPAYLERVPPDRFTGRALIYRLLADGSGFLLYSVGPNLTDDGGRSARAGGDDVAILLRLRKQPARSP